MCPHDVDTNAELAKLPALCREKGWSCTEVKDNYSSSSPGNWIQGGSGPEFKSGEIRGFTGTAFQVIAREDDLKVRIGWPGQFTTTYTCYSAEQVVWWLERIISLADQEVSGCST